MFNEELDLYIKNLLVSEKEIENKKGRCALEYYFLMTMGEYPSSYKLSKKWKVSSSTSHYWCKEFMNRYELSEEQHIEPSNGAYSGLQF